MGPFLFATLVAAFASSVATAKTDKIFVANYDLKIHVGQGAWHLQMQARVRDGSTFPIMFDDYRIDIQVADIEDGQYRADLNVFEQSYGAWFKVNTESLSFEASYSTPVEFKWTVGDMAFDLAISIAEEQPYTKKPDGR